MAPEENTALEDLDDFDEFDEFSDFDDSDMDLEDDLPSDTEDSDHQEQRDEPVKKKKKNIFGKILFSLVLISVLAVAGWFYYTQSDLKTLSLPVVKLPDASLSSTAEVGSQVIPQETENAAAHVPAPTASSDTPDLTPGNEDVLTPLPGLVNSEDVILPNLTSSAADQSEPTLEAEVTQVNKEDLLLNEETFLDKTERAFSSEPPVLENEETLKDPILTEIQEPSVPSDLGENLENQINDTLAADKENASDGSKDLALQQELLALRSTASSDKVEISPPPPQLDENSVSDQVLDSRVSNEENVPLEPVSENKPVEPQEKNSDKPESKIQETEKNSIVEPQIKAPIEKPEVKLDTEKPKKVLKPVKMPDWIIRSALPGRATIYDKNSGRVISIEKGDTVRGLGKISLIGKVNGKWIIKGSEKTLSQ